MDKWIPVSEKLPEPATDVLVTFTAGSINGIGIDAYSLVEIDGFEGYGKDVIAWMPLPEPYKTRSEGDKE